MYSNDIILKLNWQESYFRQITIISRWSSAVHNHNEIVRVLKIAGSRLWMFLFLFFSPSVKLLWVVLVIGRMTFTRIFEWPSKGKIKWKKRLISPKYILIIYTLAASDRDRGSNAFTAMLMASGNIFNVYAGANKRPKMTIIKPFSYLIFISVELNCFCMIHFTFIVRMHSLEII